MVIIACMQSAVCIRNEHLLFNVAKSGLFTKQVATYRCYILIFSGDNIIEA